MICLHLIEKNIYMEKLLGAVCFWPFSLHPLQSTYERACQQQGSSFKNVDQVANQSMGLKADKRSKIGGFNFYKGIFWTQPH
jgi:hypothetical protein